MNSLNKTFLPNLKYEKRNWLLIDCKDQKLGRLSTQVVSLLKGKIKSHYYPSTDLGDYIILINAKSIVINKNSKRYIVNKPGRPGKSLKIKNVMELLPKQIIESSVKGMLPKTKTKYLMRRLKIFNTQKHSHSAQNPIVVNLSNIYSTN